MLPLFYLGFSPFYGVLLATLFAMIHYPTYPTWTLAPKAVAYFCVGMFILPHFGIWPIVAGHLILDSALIGLEKAAQS